MLRRTFRVSATFGLPVHAALLLAALLFPSSSPAAVQCDVVVGVDQAGPLGSLNWSMNYATAGGSFVGTGPNPSCTNLVSGTLAAYMDHDAQSVLQGGWVTDGSVATPADVASCVFQAEVAPLAKDFLLTVTEASDPDAVSVVPLPTMKVVRIDCVPVVTTTTTTTTTSSSTTTSTTLPPPGCRQWDVVFRLSSSSAALSSVQVEVDYSKPPGGFVGAGSSVSCTRLTSSSLLAAQDTESERKLTVGIVDLDGISAPANLFSCVFASESSKGLVAADLPFQVIDTTDPDGSPVSASITMSLVPSATTVSCSAQCGDGVVQGSEQCDDGNTANTDACLNSCVVAACGDGFLRSGVETCDDGNVLNSDGCLATCVPATCGDGFVRTGVEACDDANSVQTDGCLNSCVAAKCGDGFVRTGVETCDDGNFIDTDACPGSCAPARCGDGYVRAGVEPCDDGNALDTDACLNSCVAAKCGDGFTRAGVEACDDGNTLESDACLSTCSAARCGDGFVRTGVEACDDANSVQTDGCLNSCAVARCGDGHVRSGVEACDDGNLSDTDACLQGCKPASCGDGYVRAGVEQCDDANTGEFDGCSTGCLTGPRCSDPSGDGRVLAGDALRILQGAVALDVECPDWTCDANGDGKVTASDSKLALTASVGLPAILKCRAPNALVLRMTSASSVAGLQVDVDYQDAPVDLPGDGGAVLCTGLVPGASFAFNDQAPGNLSMSMIALSDTVGPRTLARCQLTPDGMVKPQQFFVSIVDAVAASGAPVGGVQVKAIPY